MSFAWVLLAVLGVLWLLKGAASEMFQEEARTRLDRLPGMLIRLAVLGLPKEMRGDTGTEWQAELASMLRDTDGLPLTRLLRGVLYAAGMFRAAVLIARDFSIEKEGVVSLVPTIDCMNLTPVEFEHLLRSLFQKIPGFADVRYTSGPGDRGVDILAVNDTPLVGGRVAIQAKHYSLTHKVDTSTVRQLKGSISYSGFDKGIIITTSGFTSDARQEAEQCGIELYDGERLLWLLRRYLYQEFTIGGLTRREPPVRKPSRLRTLFRLCSGRR